MSTTTEAPLGGGVSSITGWRRVGIGAAVAMAIWSVTLQLVIGAFIPPVTGVGVLFVLLGIGLSRSTATWVHAATALLPLLALAGNTGPILADLSHPEAAAVFTLTVVSVVGALVTSASGFILWFDRAHGAAGPVAAVAGGLVVVAAAIGVVSASGVENAPALAGDVTVEARALRFTPMEIVFPTGAGGIWVDNPDPVAHTFSIGGTDIDLDVPANSSQRVDVTLEPGTYSVFCAIPGHESMTATLRVEG
jgi:plastocyanin